MPTVVLSLIEALTEEVGTHIQKTWEPRPHMSLGFQFFTDELSKFKEHYTWKEMKEKRKKQNSGPYICSIYFRTNVDF